MMSAVNSSIFGVFGAAQATFVNAAQARAARTTHLRQPLNVNQLKADSTRPSTGSNLEQVYIAQLVNAMVSTDQALDNAGIISKMTAKFTSSAGNLLPGGQQAVEAHAWVFLDAVTQYHSCAGPQSLKPRTGNAHDPIRTGEGSFGHHTDDLCELLELWKCICLRAWAGQEKVQAVVDDVIGAFKATMTNFNGNSQKAARERQAKRAFEELNALHEKEASKSLPASLKRKSPTYSDEEDGSDLPPMKKIRRPVSAPAQVNIDDAPSLDSKQVNRAVAADDFDLFSSEKTNGSVVANDGFSPLTVGESERFTASNHFDHLGFESLDNHDEGYGPAGAQRDRFGEFATNSSVETSKPSPTPVNRNYHPSFELEDYSRVSLSLSPHDQFSSFPEDSGPQPLDFDARAAALHAQIYG